MVKITLFAQIVQLLNREIFDNKVNQHKSNKHSKGIDSWTHLISMIFCHFGGAASVRDISNGLRSITGNIYHFGCRQVPSKSSISYVNQKRKAVLFKDYYFALQQHFQQQMSYSRAALRYLKRKIFILDATVIPLCLSLYNWAEFRSRKGAVKLHTVLDFDGCLPVFADLTNGKVHEIQVARELEYPKGSVLVFDMGYYDFSWWRNLDSKGIFFVTRAKENLGYRIVDEYNVTKEKNENILKDIDIEFTNPKSNKDYPKKIRLVKCYDPVKRESLWFLTNNRSWTASTVAEVYKERWQIETFFKKLKQRMKIKTFIGLTENAVQIQVWTALIAMLVLSYLKAKAKYPWHLSNLTNFLRLNLFVKIDLWEWINEPFTSTLKQDYGQLDLFTG